MRQGHVFWGWVGGGGQVRSMMVGEVESMFPLPYLPFLSIMNYLLDMSLSSLSIQHSAFKYIEVNQIIIWVVRSSNWCIFQHISWFYFHWKSAIYSSFVEYRQLTERNSVTCKVSHSLVQRICASDGHVDGHVLAVAGVASKEFRQERLLVWNLQKLRKTEGPFTVNSFHHAKLQILIMYNLQIIFTGKSLI